MIITIKLINGTIKERLTVECPLLIPASIINACNGGKSDPPRMAMIKPAEPNFTSSPILQGLYRKSSGTSRTCKRKPRPGNTCQFYFQIQSLPALKFLPRLPMTLTVYSGEYTLTRKCIQTCSRKTTPWRQYCISGTVFPRSFPLTPPA